VQDFEGETHWARRNDLTTRFRCVVVRSTVATLRQKPSTSALAADLKTLERYTPHKRLDSDGAWLHVVDEAGHQAWIHESTIWKPAKIARVQF
jgi:hypothetical protein